MRRRTNEGTVHPVRWKGEVVSWRGLASYVDPATGTRHRKSVSRKTKEEAEKALAALIRKLPKTRCEKRPRTAVDATFPPAPREDTVHALLARWVEYKHRDIRPATYREYVRCMTLALPHVGEIPLQQLNVLDVEKLVDTIHHEHSPKGAARVLRVLSMALRQGVRWQMLPGNVAQSVRAPRVRKAEMQVWTPQQVERFLQVAAPHRLSPLFALALSTGMRKGELLALQWQDIDLTSRELTVRRNLVVNEAGQYELGLPKTESGHRKIILASDTVEMLRQHWEAEKRGWRTPRPEHFVFTSSSGTHVEPRHLAKVYKRLIAEAGLPRIRFHDLRHTSASLLIRQGVAPKVVADRLGHADVRFTLQVYTHVYDDQRAEAALPIKELLHDKSKSGAKTGTLDSELASGSLEALRELHAALGRLLTGVQ